MWKFIFLQFFIFFIFSIQNGLYTVSTGNHYHDGYISSFRLLSGINYTVSIKLTNSTARYIFTNPEESSKCFSNWNKLFGKSRCMQIHHQDSDRFVFRRNQDCLTFDNDGNFLGENVNSECTEEELQQVSVAGYAYDNGAIPYKNYGTLLKVFNEKLRVNRWYRLIMHIIATKTVYEIYEIKGDTYDPNFISSFTFLESLEIDHRDCNSQNWGYNLELYFGGSCPAPEPVSIYYLNSQTSVDGADIDIVTSITLVVLLVLFVVCAFCCSVVIIIAVVIGLKIWDVKYKKVTEEDMAEKVFTDLEEKLLEE